MKIRGLAFLVECPGCRGDGKIVLPGIDFRCIKCNGHGQFIRPAENQEIEEYLEEVRVSE